MVPQSLPRDPQYLLKLSFSCWVVTGYIVSIIEERLISPSVLGTWQLTSRYRGRGRGLVHSCITGYKSSSTRVERFKNSLHFIISHTLLSS